MTVQRAALDRLVDLVERAGGLPSPTRLVRNAGKRFAPGAVRFLPWHETADMVAQLRTRNPDGAFSRSNGGERLTGRESQADVVSLSGPHQEALATADERAHGEFHSVVPRGMVESITGDRGGVVVAPVVMGRTSLSPAELDRHLQAAGFTFHDHPSLGHEYRHAGTGARVRVHAAANTPPGQASPGSRVRYEPHFSADHPDVMSRVAEAASFRAHVVTGNNVGGLQAGPAAHHREAADAHSIAWDKADEENRAYDVEHHLAMKRYHLAVAARLEGGG